MQDLTDQIGHILEGNFDYDSGSLDFSCTIIELDLRPGECYEGSFGIEVHGGGHTVGWIGSSDIRMECLTRDLTGADEEVAFRFHGEQLQAGEAVRAAFMWSAAWESTACPSR